MPQLILITGATSGFGEATARLFAAQGWQVVLSGRRRDRLDALQRELDGLHGPCAHALHLDVTDRAEVERAIGSLAGPWSAIDVLVNNAGLASSLDPIDEGDIDDWERMIDTNLKGLLYVTRAVVPGMVARGRGHIVNIGSIAGKQVYPKGNVYSATKHAVDALSRAMRLDLVQHGIRVTQVAPGAASTEFSQVRFHGDAGRARQVYEGYTPLVADDIADAVYYAATRPPHVCIDDIVITPTAQGNATTFKRR